MNTKSGTNDRNEELDLVVLFAKLEIHWYVPVHYASFKQVRLGDLLSTLMHIAVMLTCGCGMQFADAASRGMELTPAPFHQSDMPHLRIKVTADIMQKWVS